MCRYLLQKAPDTGKYNKFNCMYSFVQSLCVLVSLQNNFGFSSLCLTTTITMDLRGDYRSVPMCSITMSSRMIVGTTRSLNHCPNILWISPPIHCSRQFSINTMRRNILATTNTQYQTVACILRSIEVNQICTDSDTADMRGSGWQIRVLNTGRHRRGGKELNSEEEIECQQNEVSLHQ